MKKLFILTAVAATFTACSFDKDLGESSSQSIAPAEQIPLTLGYSMGVVNQPAVTRGNFNGVQSDYILNGGTDKESDGTTEVKNTLGLFIIKEGGKSATTGEAYERFNLPSVTLNSNDPTNKFTLINSVTSGKELVYPENKTQKIDIYAYAPHSSTASVSDITSDLIEIDTKDNQTLKADYMASDALWGCAGTGTYIQAAAATTGTGGPYEKLKGTASQNASNKNEISAQYYKIVKDNKTISTPISYTQLGSSQQSGAYYFTYNISTGHSADVIVPMLHRGSKIVVNLYASGMELAKLQNAVVKFYVDYTKGELNISNGDYKEKTGETATRTAITLTDRLGIEATLPDDGTGNAPSGTVTEEGKFTNTTLTPNKDYYTCSAVIIPHKNWTANGDNAASSPTNKGTKNIIEIELYSDAREHDTSTGSSGKSQLTATYGYKTGEEAFTYEAGKVYTYDITVKASGLTVTTTVSDWLTDSTFGTSGTQTGNADLQ